MKNLERIGSDYGGWYIPKGYLNENSICYCAGAGEDISFDAGIAEKYNSQVYIFDPTPRAKEHFIQLTEKTKNGESFWHSEGTYDISAKNLKNFHYLDYGLWHEEKIMKFYSPGNPAHVSHSITNLQKTSEYFEAQVKRLSNIMNEFNHNSLDLLKLDIEGAEYDVIDSVFEDNLNIHIICVEFDEIYNKHDEDYKEQLDRISLYFEKMASHNYILVHTDFFYNSTFIKKPVFEKLNG